MGYVSLYIYMYVHISTKRILKSLGTSFIILGILTRTYFSDPPLEVWEAEDSQPTRYRSLECSHAQTPGRIHLPAGSKYLIPGLGSRDHQVGYPQTGGNNPTGTQNPFQRTPLLRGPPKIPVKDSSFLQRDGMSLHMVFNILHHKG